MFITLLFLWMGLYPDQMAISVGLLARKRCGQILTGSARFDTVIMGRNTYEFGYAFGLEPGQLAYPHMEHYIFSSGLTFENQHKSLHIKELELKEITKLKQQSGSDIYLCGGGQFAGWLLDHQQIDILKVKLNPLILSDGIKLFGESNSSYQLELLDTQLYEYGLQFITYEIKYE